MSEISRFLEALENGDVISFSISTVEKGEVLGQYNRINGKFGALIGSIEANKHDLLQDAYVDNE